MYLAQLTRPEQLISVSGALRRPAGGGANDASKVLNWIGMDVFEITRTDRTSPYGSAMSVQLTQFSGRGVWAEF